MSSLETCVRRANIETETETEQRTRVVFSGSVKAHGEIATLVNPASLESHSVHVQCYTTTVIIIIDMLSSQQQLKCT